MAKITKSKQSWNKKKDKNIKIKNAKEYRISEKIKCKKEKSESVKKVNIIKRKSRIKNVSWKQRKQNSKCWKIEKQENIQKDKRIQFEEMAKHTIWNVKKRKREYIKNIKEVSQKCKEKKSKSFG